MARLFFGALLSFVGLVYLWFAYEALVPGLQTGDWATILGAVLLFFPGLAAAFGGVNIVLTRRRW
jgi:hypothetical protein